jgi:WD40 repeat protein
MNAQPNREVALFSAALELPVGERAAYLDKACADDPALRQRLGELLCVHQDAITFLENKAPGAQASPIGAEVPDATIRLSVSPAEKAGDRIGRYKLLQQIGEGGCGVVYMAEQEEPVRRRVALKVIKLGMDTKQVIARFEADATDTGRPFFVMELVRGIKITDYCDQNELSTEERLDLFIQVCHAVQHAHQKGIIHRDIKPSNILVTIPEPGAPGCPKVIDFGIAKATTGQALTDKTVFTAFEQFIGTPAYMSPEQAMMTALDLDTRTDIYSLGVLLYELLTSKTPLDQKELLAAGMEEMRRTIREKEPVRPSTRLSTMLEGELTTTAKHRHTDAPKLIHAVRGDLDWIVMKCLEKDRARRYETANGLANDVQRHLNCEPVAARPPSRLYEIQKTVRRHKFGFGATVAVIIALAGGMLASVWEAGRAKQAEWARESEAQRARQEAARARLAETEANEKSKLARASADEARRQQRLASDQELLARRRFYAAQMNLANQAVEAGQLGRALQLLETQRPKAATEDLRTFEWYHLWGLCNAHLRVTLRGHKGPVGALAISSDGKTLASGSHDSTICFWEMATGRQRITLQLPPPAAAGALAFTPDGRILAAGCTDSMVRLWETTSGRIRATLPAQRGWVRSLAISPEGSYLLCGGDEGVIRQFDLATEAEAAAFSADQVSLSIAFSQDGSKLASASLWGPNGPAGTGGTVRIWEPGRGRFEQKVQVAVPTRSLAFSPDGKMLAISDPEPQLRDTTTGRLLATLKGHSPPVQSLAWLPDGKALVSCASDRTVRLWPMPPTKSVVTENQILGEHLDAVLCLAISADGTTVASGGNDGLVKLWNARLTQEQTEVRFSSCIRIGTGSRSGAVLSLSFSPDGTNVIGGMEHALAARNIVSGEEYPALPGAAGRAALSPDGKLLASGDQAGTVKLWDYAGRRLLATVNAHNSEVMAIAFSPDGRMLATGAISDPILKAWAPEAALSPLWETDTKFATGIRALAFSPDGKTIAVVVRLNTVASFDASTGRPNSSYSFQAERGHTVVGSLAYAPNGKFLTTGSETGGAKVWSTETGWLHARLQGHAGTIRGVAFSPDGGTIATASEDQTVRLWDVATGQERMTFKGFQAWVTALAFSPDGNTLVAATSDARVWLWRANRSAEATAYGEPATAGEQAEAVNHTSLLTDLANARINEGKLAEAETLLREEFIRIRRLSTNDSNKGDYDDRLAATLANLAELLRTQGKDAEAETLEREVADGGNALAQNNIAWRWATDPDVKLRNGSNAVFYAEKAVSATSRTNAMYLDTLAAAYAEVGQFTNAVRAQHETIVLSGTEEEKNDYASRLKLYALATPYRDDGVLATRTKDLLDARKFVEAEPLARDCLTLRQKQIPDDWRSFNARSMLGRVLLGLKNYGEETETMLLTGYKGMKQRENTIPPNGRPRLKEALQRLAQFYEETHLPDQAGEWKQKLAEFDQAGKQTTGP